MRAFGFAVLALGTAASFGCSRNPATGQNQLMLVSEAQEIQMGKEYDQQVIQQVGLYGDSAMQRYIQAVRCPPRGHLRAAEPAVDVPRGR